MAEASRASVGSLPNMLGLARILATPVVVVLLLADWPGSDLAAALLFAAAAFTDYLDGRIARARDQVSPLGVFMDLAADKVLVAGVLIATVEVGLVPTWIAATIVLREFIVQAVRQLAAADAVVISAGALGKAKTAATLAGLFLVLLAADALSGGPVASVDPDVTLSILGYWMLVAATVLTVLSGLDYLRGAWPLLTGAERRA